MATTHPEPPGTVPLARSWWRAEVPGGIVFAGAGLALILKTSMWAKRHYVKVKRWQPKAGRWMDWTLRRPSAQRREAVRKSEREQNELPESGLGN